MPSQLHQSGPWVRDHTAWSTRLLWAKHTDAVQCAVHIWLPSSTFDMCKNTLLLPVEQFSGSAKQQLLFGAILAADHKLCALGGKCQFSCFTRPMWHSTCEWPTINLSAWPSTVYNTWDSFLIHPRTCSWSLAHLWTEPTKPNSTKRFTLLQYEPGRCQSVSSLWPVPIDSPALY